MNNNDYMRIDGNENGKRLDPRRLEEKIQKAVRDGARKLEIVASGQQGIGGRLWAAGEEPVYLRVNGSVGQRVGSMGFSNTTIEVEGPASDDVGWLNVGAKIIIHGHATNGVANAMGQGKIYIAGDVGARAMTMTKHNPRFTEPEVWVLGGVGDFFAEFMAGGRAVICGYASAYENVLGYRPCVGMVGGKVFFRGNHRGYSTNDAILTTVGDDDWKWLSQELVEFLNAIRKPDLLATLTIRSDWQVLRARKPFEKLAANRRSVKAFASDVWNKELGEGGVLGGLSTIKVDRSQITLLPTGDLRRYLPLWKNEEKLAPCQNACPTGIPVQKRWSLVRRGMMDKAIDLALCYSPLPATVCGYLCPNLCMSSCTRTMASLAAVDVRLLGKASISAIAPQPAPPTGRNVAVLGGGVAGMSAAWQLYLAGYNATIYEEREELGGKVSATIPQSRIPEEVIHAELARVKERIKVVRMTLDQNCFARLCEKNDFIIIAVGAQKPRILAVEGAEKALNANNFLRQSKRNETGVGDKVVIIGAGNVGCDVASEAHRLGAKEITLIDIQEPSSFGIERKYAEAIGANFLWPRISKKISDRGVECTDGSFLPADTVIFAIGDTPELGFLPAEIKTNRGFIAVDENFRTSLNQVFAIGDAVRLGLLTEAIGAGRVAVQAIDSEVRGTITKKLQPVNKERIRMEYYPPGDSGMGDMNGNACACFSCGMCRDCGVCVAICPQGAITREETPDDDFTYKVNENACIGCGFCASACPCGIWQLEENANIL
ncbi:MAG: FAD-dependent oxidoreductase [Deltaproteobacteria bacterium]|nr:FAD-dependent oxidoreductase [Deltaproteobacteria bacterium]